MRKTIILKEKYYSESNKSIFKSINRVVIQVIQFIQANDEIYEKVMREVFLSFKLNKVETYSLKTFIQISR